MTIADVIHGKLAYLSFRNSISNSAAFVTKVELSDIGEISKDGLCISYRDNSSVAICICINRSDFVGELRFQHVLAHCTLYPISANKDTGFRDSPIRKCEDDLGLLLLDIDKTLAESDILNWNKAGHDLKQRLAVCLLEISGTSIYNDKSRSHEPIYD